MKIKPAKASPEKIKLRTKTVGNGTDGSSILAEWWKAENESELALQLCGTASYLKTNQTYRLRQLTVAVRLYNGMSVYSYAGQNTSKMDKSRAMPDDRPSFNLIESCVDTLVAKLTQSDLPEPKFLTDGGNYKQRHLAQELNRFILGEFDQTHVYEKAKKMLRDGCIMGPGALKVYRGDNDKVCVDRVMTTDLYVDDNDSLNGEPQQLIQLKLMDRDKLYANTEGKQEKAIIARTPNSYPDNTPDSGRTTASQIMVVEGWKLPSGDDPKKPGYIPGRHTITTVEGVIFDEEWHKTKFPFVFFNYSEAFLGFWGRGIGQRLFGTQMGVNRISYTISKAINLIGVPRVFVEQGSKVVKAHLNNEVGVIVTYSGIKPEYSVAQCNAPELYQERDRLIEYGYRQEGVSDMEATGEKPKGLDSGEAIRTYDDINSSRFADLSKKWEQVFVDLAYLITDVAMDIAKDTGKYETVYPNKDGTKQISLPQMDFLKNPFVVKCFTESSLPKTPAGRIATVTEQVQAGMLSLKEGRRLMKFPDQEQIDQLNNASEERIFKILDAIVEDGEYTPPDTFMDLQLANELVVKYYNLYMAFDLEQEKADMLIDFFNSVQQLTSMGTPPQQPPMPQPTAAPQPTPTSPLVPNTMAKAA